MGGIQPATGLLHCRKEVHGVRIEHVACASNMCPAATCPGATCLPLAHLLGSLVGSGTRGYANGLIRFLDVNPMVQHPSYGANCTARAGGDFGWAMVSLLAACAADPGLVGEPGATPAQGPMLIAAKGAPPPEMSALRQRSVKTPLASAQLRTCVYDALPANATSLPGVEPVPAPGCAAPPATGSPGRDFMAGGRERLRGQAIQDISASFVGGYVFGNNCGLGGGQDERLQVVTDCADYADHADCTDCTDYT